jgi:hypothetical protein
LFKFGIRKYMGHGHSTQYSDLVRPRNASEWRQVGFEDSCELIQHTSTLHKYSVYPLNFD